MNALFAVVWPVPPWPIEIAVVRPESEVMSLFAPEAAAPRFALALEAVDAPVPPSATARSVTSVKLGRWSFWNKKLVPSDHTVTVLPAGMTTPVPAAVVLPSTVEL